MSEENKQRKAVFIYSPESQRFFTDSYRSEVTENQLSVQEAREFLSEIESKLNTYLSGEEHCCRLTKKTLNRMLTIVLVIIVTVILFSLVSTYNKPKQEQGVPLVAVIAGAIGFGFMVLYCKIIKVFDQRSAKKWEKTIQDVSEYIEQTANLYRQRGLAWVLPLYFFNEIELWKYEDLTQEVQVVNEEQQQNPEFSALILNFPYNKVTKRFKTYHYSSIMTDDKVLSQEVRQFLSQMEGSISSYNRVSNTNESITTFLMSLFLLLFVGYLLLDDHLVEPASPQAAKVFQILGPLFFIYILASAFTCKRCNQYKKKKLQQIIIDSQRYLQETADHFSQKGLIWRLGSNFPSSIQLWRKELEYTQPNNQNGPSQQHPQVQSSSRSQDVTMSHASEENGINQPLIQADSLNLQYSVYNYENKLTAFPYDLQERKFTIHHYFSGLIGNRVSDEEIKKFLAGVESYLASYGQTRLFRAYFFFITFGSLWVITFFILMPVVISSFSESTGNTILDILGCITGGIILVLLIWICSYKKLLARQLAQIVEDVKTYIGEASHEFEKNGLQWVIPHSFPSHIELHKGTGINRNT